MPDRHPKRRWARLAALVAAVMVAVAAPAADSLDVDEIPLVPDTILAIEGDLVVFGPEDDAPEDDATVAAKAGSGTSGFYAGDGYTLFGRDIYYRPFYEVRLADAAAVESLRSVVSYAVTDARGATELDLRLVEAPSAGMNPGPGQIDVVVSSSSPCRGAWLACGGPVLVEGEILAGRIWVHPRTLLRTTEEQRNILEHELGHALGLGHHNGTVGGAVQVMHSTRFDAHTYQIGDRRGFTHIATNQRRTVAIERITYAAGIVTVVASGPGIEAVEVNGSAARLARSGDRVTATRGKIDGGPVTACVVTARRGNVCQSITAPSRPFGDINSVVGTATGVTVRGWAIDPQTAEPIRVAVQVSGITIDTTADKRRDDVGRAHRAYGPMHGFSTSRPALPGTHRVCLIARNVGAGSDRPLGCVDVRVGL